MKVNYFPPVSETGFWNIREGEMSHSCCEALSNWIADYLKNEKAERLYDFGCGHGQYLKRLKDAGFTDMVGFEGNPPPYKEFEDIRQQDLTKPFEVDGKGTVLFLEVAEHIPAQFTDAMLDNVANACKEHLIMSWAVREQSGHGHINCLNNDEAIALMTAKGFEFLPEETKSARAVIQDNDCPWFRNTTMVFKKA